MLKAYSLIKELAVCPLISLSVGCSRIQVGFPGLWLCRNRAQKCCWAKGCAELGALSAFQAQPLVPLVIFQLCWVWKGLEGSSLWAWAYSVSSVWGTTKLANPYGSTKAWKWDVERGLSWLCRKSSWMIPFPGDFHATATPNASWMALYNPKITTCIFPWTFNLPKNHHLHLPMDL